MTKYNAKLTEKQFFELVARLKKILNELRTYPKPHVKQNRFERGYNNGYETAIEDLEYYYIHQEATQ